MSSEQDALAHRELLDDGASRPEAVQLRARHAKVAVVATVRVWMFHVEYLSQRDRLLRN